LEKLVEFKVWNWFDQIPQFGRVSIEFELKIYWKLTNITIHPCLKPAQRQTVNTGQGPKAALARRPLHDPCQHVRVLHVVTTMGAASACGAVANDLSTGKIDET
jgi:hypothetical protein